MSSYVEKCPKPIPISKQKYAYQCENCVIEPLFGSANIRAFIPHNNGKEPYPNTEKDSIEHYDLKIEKFTNNSMEIVFTKKLKDGSEKVYLTTVSFSDFVNRIFEDQPANFFNREPPITTIQ